MTTLHIVPHTHWDREWYLPFQDMRIKLVHLVDGLLDILERDADYRCFTLDGQTSVVDDYLEVRPERRTDIERHVAAGRLLVGPWTVLPDEFLVSPEALIRNLASGARRAAQLGGRMNVGYVPDPFGHVGQLPQILAGFGIETAAFRRGLGDHPVELFWESPDGSRVLVSYLRDGYDNAARLPTEAGSFARAVRRLDDSLAKHSNVSHRLLLNGTDHHEPQPELSRMLRDADSGGDVWIQSTLPAFLDAVKAEVEERRLELDVVRGELRDPSRHHLLPGVLSSRTWIRVRNDACERELEHWAEPFHAWAERLCPFTEGAHVFTGHVETRRVRGAQALIDRAWRLLLECHPHDSICGCSVDAVHEEMRPRFDQSEQIASEISRQSLRALADSADTQALAEHGARQAVVVFNPLSIARTELAHTRLELGGGLEPFEIVDSHGRVVPHRVTHRSEEELARVSFAAEDVRPLIRGVEDGWLMGLAIESVSVEVRDDRACVELSVSEGGKPDMAEVEAGLAAIDAALSSGARGVDARIAFAARLELELVARDLPQHGFRAFGVRPATSPVAGPEVDDAREIENENLCVHVANDGTLDLQDLATGESLRGLLRFRDRGERGDSYTTDPLNDAARVAPLRDVVVERRRDTCGQALEITGMLRVPERLDETRERRVEETVDLPVRVTVRLAAGVPRADVEVELDNRADDHRLELLFPTEMPLAEAEYDGHFERVVRPTVPEAGEPDWDEQPREELPMRGFVATPSLVVAARGLREGWVAPDGTIAVTLLRSFGWLSRSDLRTRNGGAGPEFTTPGGQCHGPQTFSLSLIPASGNPEAARLQGHAFQTLPRGLGTGLHDGLLGASTSLLETRPDAFRLTAVHLANDGTSTIARGVYLGDTPGTVRIRPHGSIGTVERVRLDQTPIETLEPDAQGWTTLPARPAQLITVSLGN